MFCLYPTQKVDNDVFNRTVVSYVYLQFSIRLFLVDYLLFFIFKSVTIVHLLYSVRNGSWS